MFESVLLEEDEYERLEAAITVVEQQRCLEAGAAVFVPSAVQALPAPCSISSRPGVAALSEMQPSDCSAVAVSAPLAVHVSVHDTLSCTQVMTLGPTGARAASASSMGSDTTEACATLNNMVSGAASHAAGSHAGIKRRMLPAALAPGSVAGAMPRTRRHATCHGPKDTKLQGHQATGHAATVPSPAADSPAAFACHYDIPVHMTKDNRHSSSARSDDEPVALANMQADASTLRQQGVPACNRGQTGAPGPSNDDNVQPELPLLQLPGIMRYACTGAEVEWYVNQLLAAQPKVLGFDMGKHDRLVRILLDAHVIDRCCTLVLTEWRVSYSKGVTPPKVALIQLAYAHIGHSSRSSGRSSSCSSSAARGAHLASMPAGSIHNLSDMLGPPAKHPCADAAPQSGHYAATPAGWEPTSSTSDVLPVQLADTDATGRAHERSIEEGMPAIGSTTSITRKSSAGADCGFCPHVSPCYQEEAPAGGLQVHLPAVQGTALRVVVLLLQVHGLQQLPPNLVSVLETEAILKAGVGITGDAHKLKADWGVTLAGAVDLSEVANSRVLYHRPLITTDITTCKWSLAGLVRAVLHRHLPKERSIRCGDWEARPLSCNQQHYAALDAFAGLHLYHVLMRLAPREPVPAAAAAAILAAADEGT